MANWMIYGATGYTGQLIAHEAVKRGHQPVLAGRSEEKLRPIAEKLGLRYSVFGLNDMFTAVGGLQAAGDIQLVLHAAGPFIHTSEPMLKACLQVGAHYLDITGEIRVLENHFLYDQKARERGILVMSGVGFDIVPSDCLNKYVADQLPDAVHLEVVISALTPSESDLGISSGTLKSMLEMMPGGGYVRRGGTLMPYDFGAGEARFRFPQGEMTAVAIPWGDLATAYRTTGIPNITTYMTLPREPIQAMRLFGGVMARLMRIRAARQWVSGQIDQFLTGPTAETRDAARTVVYARATNRMGETAEAWLETVEAYRFTAEASVLAVEHVLQGDYHGALTPAQAFGADFVLNVETTRRMDTLNAL
ncbi:MAG: saccharopine dehydrogenase NADP-binding domain-containing protein [Anaerolineae bacterium]